MKVRRVIVITGFIFVSLFSVTYAQTADELRQAITGP
jgi:hypothetical protein